MNRFFDIRGDVSVQLAPWTLEKLGEPKNKAVFELQNSLFFSSDVAHGVIVVPSGYISDLASIPLFAWSIFMAPDDPRIELGAWVHDLLYQQRGFITLEDGSPFSYTREMADKILAHEAMAELGATWLQRTMVYQALRRCGDQWPGQTFSERLHG